MSLAGHECSNLEHTARGPQHLNIQLQELLRVIIVGQNNDVHLSYVTPPTQIVSAACSPSQCTCSQQLESLVIINEK